MFLFSPVAADVDIDMNRSLQGGHEVVSIANGGESNNICHKVNRPCSSSEAVSFKVEPELGLGVSEAESCHVSDLGCSAEEEGTLLIRAECVMITDEGDEASDYILASAQCKETHLPYQGVSMNGGEIVEDELKTKIAQEPLTHPKKNPEQEPAPETLWPTVAEDFYLDTNENENSEVKGEALDKLEKSKTSTETVHLPDIALEDIVLASVPVYAEVEPPTITATAEVEPLMLSAKVKDPAAQSGHFQEVPLAVHQENQRKEPRPEPEHEPLLSYSKTSESAAAADSSINVDTHSQEKKSQEGEMKAPKWKSCRCCSVM